MSKLQKKKSLDNWLHSEQLFRRLWDISADGMRMTDENGLIIKVNAAYCNIVEMDSRQIENRPFHVVYQTESPEKALEKYRNNFKNHHHKTIFEKERFLINGKMKWLEFSNSYMEIPGAGRFLLSIIKDITLRKQAELELHKSEQRYKLLFNNANDAIFVNSLTDDTRLSSYVEVNDIACRHLLYSREELLKLNPYSTIHPKYYDKINTILQDIEERKHAIFELNYLTKDRRQIPFEVSTHLFSLDEKPAILSIAREISERKRSEQSIRQKSEQLRNLASRLQNIREEERTMLAREMHDELGQVLSVLKIQVALLANKLEPDQINLKQKSEFINQLLNQTVESVQRITAKLRPNILDELGLIAAIEWQVDDFEEKTGINTKHSVTLKEEPSLNSDQVTAVFRILQEALTNVARHSAAGRVSVFLRRQNGFLVLEITDNGDGISDSQKNSPKSLGLLGMKERALLLGGELKIHGVKNEGTNVKLQVPLQDSKK